MVVREEFYFEPRVINENGNIRWYGERYTKEELLRYMGETVYIRDSGEEPVSYTHLDVYKRQALRHSSHLPAGTGSGSGKAGR